MAHIIASTLGVIGFLALVYLPGGWVTFGLPLSTWPFWTRLTIGAILAPLVVFLQFYAVRLLGASFELTAPLLVVVNLPVLVLLGRHIRGATLPDRGAVLWWGAVLLVPLLCLMGPLALSPTARLFWGHPWMHADIVYALANGELIPKEVELAGLTTSYPWAGHVYQAVLSYLLDSSPVSNFRWTNLLWLALIIQLMPGLVAIFGGRRLAAVSAVVLLLFGVNFVGYTLYVALPADIVDIWNIWGDYRYTPWVLKFVDFHQQTFALGFFIAVTVIMAKPWPAGRAWDRSLVLFLLLAGLGVIYPVLTPPAYAVVFAGGAAMMVGGYSDDGAIPYRRLLFLTAAVVTAVVITKLNLDLVTQDSTKTTMIKVTTLRGMARKTVESFLTTLPLLIGLWAVFYRCWRQSRHTTFVLVAGALASLALYVVFYIPYFTNEYKYVFTAAICLAPFAGLALEPLQERLGRYALLVTLIVTSVLALPFVHKFHHYQQIRSDGTWSFPVVDTSGFDMRLDESERLSSLSDAIRERTPVETLLVADRMEIHLPTLTRRKYFAPPPRQRGVRQGVSLQSELLLGDIKGYDRGLIRERKLVVERLFDDEEDRRLEPLDQVLELGRPVAIIIDQDRNKALLRWLEGEEMGHRLYEGEGLVLWMVRPGDLRQSIAAPSG